jgi:hypothetical protein
MNNEIDYRMLADLLKYAGKPTKTWNIGDEGDMMTVSKYPGMRTIYPVDPMSYLIRKRLGLRDSKLRI